MNSSTMFDKALDALMINLSSFMGWSVATKLFWQRQDWLVVSAVISISWTIGVIVSRKIRKEEPKHAIIEKIELSIVLAMIIAFATGVVLNWSNWYYLVINVCMGFIPALFISK